jgi:hypothetical protein
VEAQARRPSSAPGLLGICANLPPKLFESLFEFAAQQMRGVPTVFAPRAISFRVISQKARLGVVIAMGDLRGCKFNVLYGCFRVIC